MNIQETKGSNPWAEASSLACSTVLSLYIAGCASFTPTIHKVSAEQPVCLASPLVASIQKRSEELKTLQGTAWVKINFKAGYPTRGKGGEISGRSVVIVKRPDRFRVEILGPFNQTAAIITYNGTRLSLVSLQENRLYSDYPFPLDISRLPHYLLGLPASKINIMEPEDKNTADYMPDDHCLSLGSDHEQLWIDKEGNIHEIIFLPSQGGVHDNDNAVQISLGSYKEADGFTFPLAIFISNKEADISITYDRIELNQHVSDDLFSLPRMQGMEEISPVP